MKKSMKLLALAVAMLLPNVFCHQDAKAQGWLQNYGGVMLQGFYWDSYADTQWNYLERQAEDIAPYFSLVWIPQSGYCGPYNNMGYTPQYYFRQDSSFGSEQQLRSMIAKYKSLGSGFIADVVINHRNNLGENGSWVDYPAETYNGKTYQMLSTDIVRNDDGGQTLTWATNNGYELSANNDTGEGWDGCRDLDHKSENVNQIVKAYLDYLLQDLGYAGFRYDMVKGYSASYTGDYNAHAKPQFSVGEYWEGGASAIKNWIEGTKVDGQIQSAAFDFNFRYSCRDAVNGSTNGSVTSSENWANLARANMPPAYHRYAVTFVENHDTELRSQQYQQDPIRRDTLALNAWLLASPGTPCVFYKHWMAYKKEIKQLIEARRMVGITNESSATYFATTAGYCARVVDGSNGSLLVAVGNECQNYNAPTGYTEILTGYHYRYFVSSNCNTAGWAETLARIDDEESHGDFTPHTATVHVNADFTPVYFYVWVPCDNNKQLNGGWPGKQITETAEIDGMQWYTQTFDIPTQGYEFSIIFNNGSGKQTADIGHVDGDRFYIATLNGNGVAYTDVTEQHVTGIENIKSQPSAREGIYNLNGQRIDKLQRGINIIGGKKVFVREAPSPALPMGRE